MCTVRTEMLIFGPGTTLTVLPTPRQACGKINPVQNLLFFSDVLKTSDPQVIVMKSKKLEEDGSSGKAACLARNSTTKNIRLEMPSQEVVYEQSPSILTSQGLYNAIKVVRVTKDTEVTCTAKFDDLTITAQPEQEAEEPITEASERVCNSTNISAQGTSDRMNRVLGCSTPTLGVMGGMDEK
ncbi:hypothetical protein EK904_011302 [Melospiza melodia maxima]|nr:hypothetical protein EK904_011302 [Melospiza melodia maxima]